MYSLDAGVINTSIKSNRGRAPIWYGNFNALSDPDNVALSLRECQLDFKYALTDLYDERQNLIHRNKKLITVDSDDIPSDNVALLYADHKQRAAHNAKHANNPSQFKPTVKRRPADNYLAIVGSDYKLHQPQDIYEAYLRLTEYMGLTLHMAGKVNQGNSIWARIKLNEDINIKDTTIERYITLITGTSKATKAGESPQDIWCANQWNILLGKTQWYLANVAHRRLLDTASFADTIRERLDHDKLQVQLNILANSECSGNERIRYLKDAIFGNQFENVIPINASLEDREKIEKKNEKNAIAFEKHLASINAKQIDSDARRTISSTGKRTATWYGTYMDLTWLADRLPTKDKASSQISGRIGNMKSKGFYDALRLAA